MWAKLILEMHLFNYDIQLYHSLSLPFSPLSLSLSLSLSLYIYIYKVKVIPQQVEVARRFPGRLRPWIFLTFGTTRVVGRQSYAPAAFTPGEIPGTHF